MMAGSIPLLQYLVRLFELAERGDPYAQMAVFVLRVKEKTK